MGAPLLGETPLLGRLRYDPVSSSKMSSLGPQSVNGATGRRTESYWSDFL